MSRRLLGFLAVLMALLPMGAFPAAAAERTGPAVIVLGVPDLRWSDLSPSATPAMWALARRGATGALVVRSVDETTDPLDGWATLSAGNRARGGLTEEDIHRRNHGTLTGAEVGALGSALRAAGSCAGSRGGPGAALAAADRAGAPTAVGTQTCPVLLVQIDSLLGGNRVTGAAAADRAVASVVRDLPASATVLLLGLSDRHAEGARLHVAVAAGPDYPAGTRLRSASTRRAPFVQLVDVAPTVLQRLKIARPNSMIGQPFETVGPASADQAGRQSAYRDLDLQARQMHRAVPLFFVPLVVGFVLGLGLSVALHALGRRVAARRVAVAVVLPVAAAPGGAFLANLVPWWRGPVGLIWPAAVVGGALLLGVAAALTAKRRSLVPLIGMVAALTFAVVVVDLVTGARLQLSSVPGYDPLIAGRFAGIGNPGFGVLAAAALVTAFLYSRSWRSALAIGAVAVVVDGAPMWGSDVGGVLALVPGVLIIAAAASGRRISWRALAGGIASAVVAIFVFAAIDLARPAGSRTHLGRFASDLLHGHGGTTVHRKVVANWDLLTSTPATVIVPFVLAALAVITLRAGALRGTAGLAHAYERVPLLRAGLIACLVTAVLGFLLNDSGVVIPAIMMLIVVPVAVVAASDRPHDVTAEMDCPKRAPASKVLP